jgi:hypothetical protein
MQLKSKSAHVGSWTGIPVSESLSVMPSGTAAKAALLQYGGMRWGEVSKQVARALPAVETGGHSTFLTSATAPHVPASLFLLLAAACSIPGLSVPCGVITALLTALSQGEYSLGETLC